MTLIIAAGCPEFVVQVSDRRFSKLDARGKVTWFDDERNKALAVRASDALFAVSFTGIAQLGTELVPHCVLDWMSDARAPELGFDACVEAVRAGAEREFHARYRSSVPPLLVFVFAGYLHGNLRPKVIVVSNCVSERFERTEAQHTFNIRVHASTDYPYFAEGRTDTIPSNIKNMVKQLIRKTRDYPRVTDAIVAEIRQAAAHGKYGKQVGRQCMSICIFRAGRAEAVYHSSNCSPGVGHGRATP